MNTNTLLGSGTVPLIAGIIQVIKSTGLPARFAPIVALALGIGAGIVAVWQTSNGSIPWAAGLVLGITWGLAASGLYQGGKLARSALVSDGSPYPPPGSQPPAAKALSESDLPATVSAPTTVARSEVAADAADGQGSVPLTRPATAPAAAAQAVGDQLPRTSGGPSVLAQPDKISPPAAGVSAPGRATNSGV